MSSEPATLKYGLLAVIVVLAGCAGAATPDDQTTTRTTVATQTTTTTMTETVRLSMNATDADARQLEDALNETAPVDVRVIAGRFSVLWQVNSTEVALPNSTKQLANQTHTKIEFAFIMAHYFNLVENETINGSLALTAVYEGERVAVWTIEEQWVNAYYADELTDEELAEKIRETRYDFNNETTTQQP